MRFETTGKQYKSNTRTTGNFVLKLQSDVKRVSELVCNRGCNIGGRYKFGCSSLLKLNAMRNDKDRKLERAAGGTKCCELSFKFELKKSKHNPVISCIINLHKIKI